MVSRRNAPAPGLRKRRWLRAALVLSLLALLLYWTRDGWSRLVLRRWLASTLAAEVEVERVRWTGLGRVEITGLTARGAPGADGLRRARVTALELELAPLELLRHGLEGLLAARAQGLELELAGLTLKEAELRLTRAAGEARIELDAPELALQLGERVLAGPLRLRATQSGASATLADCRWGELLELAGARLELDEELLRARLQLRAPDVGAWEQGLGLAQAEPHAGALELEAELELARTAPQRLRGRIALDGHALRWQGAQIDELHADLRATGEQLLIPELTMLQGANRLSLTSALVPQRLPDACWLREESAGRFELELADAQQLDQLLSQALGASTLELRELVAHGSWGAGLLELEDLRLVSSSGVGRVTHGHLPLATGTWGTWGPELLVDPRARLELEASFADLGEIGALFGQPGLAGQLEARAELQAQADGPHGHFELAASGLQVQGRELGELAARGSLADSVLELAELSLAGPSGRLRASGRYDGRERRVVGLDLDGELPLQSGAEPVRARAHIDGPWPELSGWLVLSAGPLGARLPGVERARLAARLVRGELLVDELQLAGPRAELHARGSVADLATLTARPSSACVRIDELAGALAGRELRLERAVDAGWDASGFAVEGLELASPLGTLSASANTDGQGLRVRAALMGPLQVDLDLDLPLHGPREAHVRAHVLAEDLAPVGERLAFGQGELCGRLALDADFAGPMEALRGRLRIDSQACELAALVGAIRGPITLAAELEAAETLELRELRVEHGLLRGQVAGRLETPLDLRALLARGLAAWNDAPLDLHVTAAGEDLAPLAALAPALRRMGGRYSCELELRGTPAHPDLVGHGTLADGELRLEGLPQAWTQLAARLAFDHGRIVLEQLEGELGGAPFSATGELWPFEDEPRCDLHVTGENLLLVRTHGLRLRADADLHLSGALRRLHVGGDLALRGSRYAHEFDLFTSLGGQLHASERLRARALFELDPPLDALTFDVKVRAIDPFRLENDFVRAALRPELQLQGTGALPFLVGRVNFEPSTLMLPAAIVTVRSGGLEFLSTDPFEPRLEALAETRVQGYDVTLRASGTLSEPIVELSSIPPLSQDDLVLLVLTGRAPSLQLSERASDVVSNSMTLYVARDVLHDVLRGDLGKQLVDSLELSTAEEISRTGIESVRARMLVSSLGDHDRTRLYLTAERDIYEHYNFGLRILIRFR